MKTDTKAPKVRLLNVQHMAKNKCVVIPGSSVNLGTQMNNAWGYWQKNKNKKRANICLTKQRKCIFSSFQKQCIICQVALGTMHLCIETASIIKPVSFPAQSCRPAFSFYSGSVRLGRPPPPKQREIHHNSGYNCAIIM